MTDTVENVAQRLREFSVVANNSAAGRGFQGQVNEAPRRNPAPRPEQQVYEECVARLSDDERDALDRILEKMRAGLDS